MEKTKKNTENEDEKNCKNPCGENDEARVEECTREEGDRENDGDTGGNSSNDTGHFGRETALVNGVEAGECKDRHGDECHRQYHLEILVEGECEEDRFNTSEEICKTQRIRRYSCCN